MKMILTDNRPLDTKPNYISREKKLIVLGLRKNLSAFIRK